MSGGSTPTQDSPRRKFPSAFDSKMSSGDGYDSRHGKNSDRSLSPTSDTKIRYTEEMEHDEFSVKPPQLQSSHREKHKHRKRSEEKRHRSDEKERVAKEKHSSRDSRKEVHESRGDREKQIGRQQQYEKDDKRRERSQQERDRLEKLERERRRLEHERAVREREHQERLMREKRESERQTYSNKPEDDSRRRPIDTRTEPVDQRSRVPPYDRSRSPFARRPQDERSMSPRKPGSMREDDDPLEAAWREIEHDPRQVQRYPESARSRTEGTRQKEDFSTGGRSREDRVREEQSRGRSEQAGRRPREEHRVKEIPLSSQGVRGKDEAVAGRESSSRSREAGGRLSEGSRGQTRESKDVSPPDYYKMSEGEDDYNEQELREAAKAVAGLGNSSRVAASSAGREGDKGAAQRLSPGGKRKISMSSPGRKNATDKAETQRSTASNEQSEDDDNSDSGSDSDSESSQQSESPEQNTVASSDNKSAQQGLIADILQVKSKFESASEDEESAEEDGEASKSGNDDDNGEAASSSGGDDDDQAGDIQYVDSPPQSPIELKADLPVYLPALQGCRNVDEFTCLNRIEEGTYGVVYRAEEKKTKEIVALKRLKMEKEKEGFPITSLREINTLLKAQHPNIVTVREIVVGSNMDKIYIVMDYVAHDLKGLMENMKENFIIGEVKTLLIQLLRGVAHLHDNWIIHRDLKTSNLLLSHNGILKIGDFGLAREYGSPLKQYTPIVVTLWYRAPELLLGTKLYSTAIDMWSVGCIFAELLTKKPLFPGKSEIDELNKIFKDLGTPTEKIWPGLSELPAFKKCTFADHPYNTLKNKFGAVVTEKGIDLMNRFLTYDPARRITAEEALRHKWLQEAPSPVPPNMFPTWPSKSEQNNKRTHGNSPKPPSGGKAYANLLGEDDDEEEIAQGFHLAPPTRAPGAIASSFVLKF